jgi:hypothetical protein
VTHAHGSSGCVRDANDLREADVAVLVNATLDGVVLGFAQPVRVRDAVDLDLLFWLHEDAWHAELWVEVSGKTRGGVNGRHARSGQRSTYASSK